MHHFSPRIVPVLNKVKEDAQLLSTHNHKRQSILVLWVIIFLTLWAYSVLLCSQTYWQRFLVWLLLDVEFSPLMSMLTIQRCWCRFKFPFASTELSSPLFSSHCNKFCCTSPKYAFTAVNYNNDAFPIHSQPWSSWVSWDSFSTVVAPLKCFIQLSIHLKVINQIWVEIQILSCAKDVQWSNVMAWYLFDRKWVRLLTACFFVD